jgi:hypothetical protein
MLNDVRASNKESKKKKRSADKVDDENVVN